MDNPALSVDQSDPAHAQKDDVPSDGSKENHAAIDMGGATTSSAQKPMATVATAPYAGMGKDDLLRFSQTPFWSRLRLACLLSFWLAWLGLLVAVIVLTIVMPRCAAPPSDDWYQHSVVYDVYVPSFYDADNDVMGMGDIKGVTEKLDYLESLNVDTLALSSVYYSNHDVNNDVFNDVINHTQVDDRLGSLADVRTLVQAAHDKGMKVLLDFIPNHTSRKHPWFVESEKSSDHTTNPYWNYYVWAACTNTSYPNNWLSIYGNSSWEYNPNRAQCYLHNFLKDEPELNLRSSSVQEELADILRYWLREADVDGFRIRSASFLFEDADLRDDEVIVGCSDPNDYSCLDHVRTRGQDENYVIVNQWRKVIDEFSGKRILVIESSDSVNQTAEYYGGSALVGAQLPINVQLSKLGDRCDGNCVRNLVSDWLEVTPSGGTANWATSSSEFGRLERHPIGTVHMLKLTLPGTAFTYYGEELGMRNGNGSTPSVDPAGNIDMKFSRDPYRSPMQWSGGPNAGFTNHTDPWLPLNDDAAENNVEIQQSLANSPLSIFKSLTELRTQEGALQYGNFTYVITNENIISYTRQFNGKNSFLVAINFGSSEAIHDYSAASETVPSEAEVVLTTSDRYKVEDTVSLKNLALGAGEGILVKWAYKR